MTCHIRRGGLTPVHRWHQGLPQASDIVEHPGDFRPLAVFGERFEFGCGFREIVVAHRTAVPFEPAALTLSAGLRISHWPRQIWPSPGALSDTGTDACWSPSL